MKLANVFKTRKYLSHIFLLITISIMLTISIFSTVIYFNATRIFQQKEYESSSQLLYQEKYNINQMDSAIKNLSSYLFFNNDIRSIMYSKDEFNDFVDLAVKINKLAGSIMSSNSFIDSMVIYNHNLDETLYIGKSLYFDDMTLKEAIHSNRILPLLKPIPRKIENVLSGNKKFENVFSYYMYDDIDKSNHMDGAVIINVKYDWFLDNLNLINMIEQNKGDNIFLLNNNQEFVDNETGDVSLRNSLRDGYLKNRSKSAQDGFFEDKLNGKDYLITYVYVESTGFTLLKMQPSSEVYKHLDTLKTTVVVTTLIFLILTFIISITISRSIYRPVANLVKQVTSINSQKTDKASYRDEISYLGHAYKQSLDKLHLFSEEKNQYKYIMKEYWLKKLFLESYSFNESTPAELRNEKSISVILNNDIMVCVIKIDNYSDFRKIYNDKYQELLRFAVLNVSTEMLSNKFTVDGVDMNDDHIALIISISADELNYMDDIENLLSQTQSYIQQYYRFTVTASVSNKTSSIKDISKIYNDALNNTVYRFVLGRMSIITPAKIKHNIENGLSDYPRNLEIKLLECIKSGKSSDFEDTLQKLFNEISKLDYDNIIISLLRLTDTLKKAVDAAMKSRIEPMLFNFPAISRELFELEYIDDFYWLLVDSIRKIVEKDADQGLHARNSMIIDTVLDLITKNYFDNALSQDQLASIIKISPRRLSKIFKDGTQLSIPEQINEVRLHKAAEWLEKTELSVHEIIAKVGIENETYFYAIFKKKFGTTPKEYALQKKIKRR